MVALQFHHAVLHLSALEVERDDRVDLEGAQVILRDHRGRGDTLHDAAPEVGVRGDPPRRGRAELEASFRQVARLMEEVVGGHALAVAPHPVADRAILPIDALTEGEVRALPRDARRRREAREASEQPERPAARRHVLVLSGYSRTTS